MLFKKVFIAITLLWAALSLSCVSSPKYLTGYGTLAEQVNEAERIIDNARGYTMTEEDEDALIMALDYFPPPFVGKPQPPTVTQLSAYELEQKMIQYERDLKKWEDEYAKQISDAAKIRRAAIKILGQRPSMESFEAITQMLFDPDPGVRSEALTVIKRANPITAPIIYDAVSSSEMDEDVRLVLIQQLYNFGDDGEAFLIELLANDDELIAAGAAKALQQRYPRYPNAPLKALATSNLSENRYKSPYWLVVYQKRQALEDLLTIANELNTEPSERAQMLFNDYGQWVIDDLIVFLHENRYPNARLLMINKVAQFNDERGMTYVVELLDSDDNDYYYRGMRYAKVYGIRFLPIAVNLFSHPNERVRLSAIEVASNYQDSSAVIAALPLITDPSPRVSAAAINYVKTSVSYSEAALAKAFTANARSRSDYFIMQTLISHGSSLILYDNEGMLSFSHLYYLFTHADTNQWFNYVDSLKSSKLQIELQALYSLYQATINFNSLKEDYLKTALVQQANQLVALVVANSQTTQANNTRFDSYLENKSTNFNDTGSQQRQNLASALGNWPAQVRASSESSKISFRDYSKLNNDLLSNYLAIKREHQPIAERFLNAFGISIGALRAFNSLNLKA